MLTVICVLNTFGLSEDKHIQADMEKLAMREFSKYDLAYRKLKSERLKRVLIEKINSLYSEKDSFPNDMSFKEDDVELLSDKIGKVYSLDNAIYIGTPTAISLRQSDKVMMNDLKNKVVSSNDKSVDNIDDKQLIDVLCKMMNISTLCLILSINLLVH